MLRQLAARFLAFCLSGLACGRFWCGWCRGLGLGFGLGFDGLELLELQLELRDLALNALRRAAVPLPPESGELEFELLDLERIDHEPGLGRGEFSGLRKV